MKQGNIRLAFNKDTVIDGKIIYANECVELTKEQLKGTYPDLYEQIFNEENQTQIYP